jgi:hypothetical protein
MSIDLHSVITLPQAEVNASLYEVHLFYSLAWCVNIHIYDKASRHRWPVNLISGF